MHRYRFYSWVVLLVGLVFLNVACSSGKLPPILQPAASPDVIPADQVQQWLDGIDELRSRYDEMPEHFVDDDPTGQAPILEEGDFNANLYFDVLDHLSMEPGYALDYIYQMIEMLGGEPVLYARAEDAPAFDTYAGYTALPDSQERRSSEPVSDADYLRHVQVDGTREGYFQLVLLQVFGEQFYLFWHSNYSDTAILPSWEPAVDVINAMEDFGCYAVTDETREDAKALDYDARVEIGDDTVKVRFVAFSKWGGFFELIYTIRREFPHEIVDREKRELVPYDCGIVF